jgi:glycosyltransferase involved in cell wall biosynthesis
MDVRSAEFHRLIQSSDAVRLAVVGAMVGRHQGYVPQAGELLARRLREHGYPVVITSDQLRRPARLADIVTTLVRRRGDVDVQILQVYGGPSFIGEDLASLIGRWAGHKIVMHLHGGAIPGFIERFPRWSRRVLGRATAFVAPSPFLKRALEARGYPVRIIPNALELEQYVYRRRGRLSPRLFWMRTFHDVYNPELAVRVLARVRQQAPGATLVMAGQEKGTQSAVRDLAGQLGLGAAVSFPGFLDSRGKADAFDAADIFLNTNRIDNTPVSVLEACASGVPVVATDVGGISDFLVHGESALLVPDDDDAAMAEAVLSLINAPALAQRLSTQGRQLAERHSWHNTRRLWDELLHDMTGAPVPETN